MINKKYLKLLRSKHRFDNENFIYKIISKRIIDSIDLLNIDIRKVLEIGINENTTYNFINDKFKDNKIDRSDLCISKNNLDKEYNFLQIDLENINFNKNYYDLVYSNLFLHLTPNFEHCLRCINDSLKPNGFFISTIPDKDCMYQLLNSMYHADLDMYNGAYQRANPTIEIDRILKILKNLNFDAPSIYSDNISIEYSSFNKMLSDIKKMNISYSYKDKKKIFEKKEYFKKLEKFFKENYYKNNYLLDIKINIISCWKK